MKKIILFSVICAASQLSADFFAWDFGTRLGYRQDQVRTFINDSNFPNENILNESFNRLRSAEIDAFTKIRFWWVEAGIDADYSWTVSGNAHTMFSLEGPFYPPRTPVKFKSDATGNCWDAIATAGLRVPIYNCGWNTLFVTPLGGYSYHQISEKTENTSPSSRNIGLFFSSNPTFVSLFENNRLSSRYQGPFAGVAATIDYFRFHTNFGYAYHWAQLDQKINSGVAIDNFFSGATILENLTLKNSFTPNRNHGNRAWLSLNYADPFCWRVGLYGSYFQVSSSRKNSTNKIDGIPTTNLAKSKWQTFSVMLEGAYEF